MSRTTDPLALEIAIQDDDNADVVSPNSGSVVATLTADPDSSINTKVYVYASSLAKRQGREVLARITRGDDFTCVRVPADGSPPERIDLRTGDTSPLSGDETDPVTADLDLGPTAPTEDLGVPAGFEDLPQVAAEDVAAEDMTATEPLPVIPAEEPSAASGPMLVSTDHRAPAITPADDLGPAAQQGRPTSAERRPRPRRRPSAGPFVPDTQSAGDKAKSVLSRLGDVCRRHRTPMLVLLLAAVVIAAGAGVLFGKVLGPAADTPSMPTTATAPAVTQDPTSDEVECPTKTEGNVSTGRGPGNQTSGVQVIRAFNWAYYQWRNAQAARAMVSANGKVGSVLDMQAAIDVLIPGLRYCLAITDAGNDSYDVQISEIPPTPGASPRVINQVVQTQNIDGRWWITSFAKPTHA